MSIVPLMNGGGCLKLALVVLPTRLEQFTKEGYYVGILLGVLATVSLEHYCFLIISISFIRNFRFGYKFLA
jgi:uncharacterized membrane protein